MKYHYPDNFKPGTDVGVRALTPEQEKQVRKWAGESIQYGFHTDDNGPNEGAGYVLDQVDEILDNLLTTYGLVADLPVIVTVAAIVMEESEGYHRTLDLTMEMWEPDWYSEHKNVEEESVEKTGDTD